MRVFLSYSHKDGEALQRLRTHLAPLRRQGHIEAWYDREILAGSELDAEISVELESCQLFLLLVSPDFLASVYCYEREMSRALERHESGEVRVIPIIIEPCDWRSSPLGRLKALPNDAVPVSEWPNQNSAYFDIVNELRRVVTAEDAPSSPVVPTDTPMVAPTPRTRRSGYRIRRDFDQIDRSEFREAAFTAIHSYFQTKIAEINDEPNLRGRFSSATPSSFSCTVVNRALDRGTAHITVRSCSGNSGFGEISFAYSENAPEGSANGFFTIEADEYELYLRGLLFGFGHKEDRFSPEGAAEHLWLEFLQHAGISYD